MFLYRSLNDHKQELLTIFSSQSVSEDIVLGSVASVLYPLFDSRGDQKPTIELKTREINYYVQSSSLVGIGKA